MMNKESFHRLTPWPVVVSLLLLAVCWPGPAVAADKIAVVIGKGAPPIEIRAGQDLQAQLSRLTGTEVSISTDVPNTATLIFFLGSPATNPAIQERFGATWPELSDQGVL
ncbi:MAG: hypothetical protein QGH11_13425, partial [Pirellulaceae bacterium]|nr:hypothetical protein [Pirellulaceae bacterium]